MQRQTNECRWTMIVVNASQHFRIVFNYLVRIHRNSFSLYAGANYLCVLVSYKQTKVFTITRSLKLRLFKGTHVSNGWTRPIKKVTDKWTDRQTDDRGLIPGILVTLLIQNLLLYKQFFTNNSQITNCPVCVFSIVY